MLTFINESTDPFYNQAFEEFVFENYAEDDVFYLWQNRPAIVVGCYQNICREVNVHALRRRGVPVVRRMTGGGTVYHDLGNVNYSFMLCADGPLDYDHFLDPVIAALNRMGIPAHKNRSCDIAIGDKKISGSAQKAAGGRILHHGTLLFESDLASLDAFTAHAKNDAFQTKGTLSAICTVTNIRDHLSEPMTIADFRSRLLAEVLPANHVCVELTDEQRAQVRKLRNEKYRSWDWIWGKTPTFSYERAGSFAGHPLRVAYKAKKGVLCDACIESPVIDAYLAASLMNGSRLDPDGFAKICFVLAGSRAEELLELLM
ncbi:MAG: lipoate--protein ligase [Clostridia bacterium]|nr:lipoate--protein ligase [Clostridia bacterium]